MLLAVHVLVKTSIALAALAAFGALLDRSDDTSRRATHRPVTAITTATPSLATRPCGAKQIFDPASGRCVRWNETRRSGPATPVVSELRLPSGRDVIARIPDRPSPWTSYVLPVDPLASAEESTERPGVLQITADAASVISAPSIERSEGKILVVHVGPLHGKPVIILQYAVTVRPTVTRTLLVILSEFGRPARGIVTGTTLSELSPVAYMRDHGGPTSYTFIEGRWVHPGPSPGRGEIVEQLSAAASSRVDLRNVLSTKVAPRTDRSSKSP